MSILSPGTEIYRLYHVLWTKAVGQSDYVKDDWLKFGEELEKAAKGPTTVLQSWVERIPIRMQSTLILGLRGPDTHCAPNIKAVTRWMRGLAFKPGNPFNVAEFMGYEPPELVEKGPLAKELEFCSQHYYSHLMHSLEVIAYRHPDGLHVGRTAFGLYWAMSRLLHLSGEERCEFEERLKILDWPKKQPDTFEEAMKQLEMFPNWGGARQ